MHRDIYLDPWIYATEDPPNWYKPFSATSTNVPFWINYKENTIWMYSYISNRWRRVATWWGNAEVTLGQRMKEISGE
jgi:hypothetical protein